MTRWRIVLASAALAGFVASPAANPAHAQMAAALGKPLPDSNLATGTVTVRVIAGAPDKPLVGIDAKLVAPDGAERSARTDAEGRARFTNLTPGKQYLARAEEPATEEGQSPKQAKSQPFTVPSSGGLRLMISTRPWQGAGGMAGAAGAGMMDPRRMSGIPRGEPNDAAETLTVSAVKGVVTQKIPDQMIHLVGYGADGSISLASKKTGEDGRARFENLSLRNVAYYAMTTYARGPAGSVIHDRVASRPILMPPQVGIRLMLAGLPDEDKKPPIDDLERMVYQGQLDPGNVVLRLRNPQGSGARLDANMTATLFEIAEGDGSHKKIATAKVGPPTPQAVKGQFGDAVQRAEETVGTVVVSVATRTREPIPLPEVMVELVPMGPDTEPQAATPEAQISRQKTDREGQVRFGDLVPGTRYRAVITSFGPSRLEPKVHSAPFVVPAAGGLLLSASLEWQIASSAEARFENVPPGKLYFAEVESTGKSYRSAPFLTVFDRGSAISAFVVPEKHKLWFHMTAFVDDEYVRFRAQMAIINWSYAPWNAGPDGVLIPLPDNFVAAQVADDDADKVAIDNDHGLIWRYAVPPLGEQFLAGFAVPAENGRVDFRMDLPSGVAGSNIMVVKTPGMTIEGLPESVKVTTQKARTGRDLFVIEDIDIAPQRSMAFSIAGLPQRPALQRYLQGLIGISVLGILAWGVIGIFRHRRREAQLARTPHGSDSGETRARQRKLKNRREQLLDDLVSLEGKKKGGDVAGAEYDRQRAKLKKELERVYADLDEIEGRDSSAA